MGKTKTREDEEDEVDIMSDPESSISSEVEDPPSTSPREQYSTATSSSRFLSGEGSKGSVVESSASSSPSLSGSRLQGLRMGLPAPFISPEDVLRSVFLAIEEMGTDSTFLVSAIVEYMRSTSKENVRVPSGLQALLVQLLGHDERYHELRQFVAGKLIDPSRAVALQLLEVGNSDVETRKMGMEMLRLLHAHSDYVKLLLQDGRLLEGPRYVRQNKVDAIPPAMFLEAAVATNDVQKLSSVLRFYLDFLPGFQQTPDFNLYLSRLNQQCSVGNGC